MDLRMDDRGQAIQVGAILLFAMLIVAMSVYQAQVVPRENAEIEWDSYLDASSDMTKLRNDILGTAATNNQRGTTVTTGTTYPARVFFVNPGPATGRIATGDAELLSLSNVRSTGSHQNVDAYLQSENSTLTYTTRDVAFRPSYNEISGRVAPVVVANGLTYRNYSTPIPITTQTMIQGNRLTFVTVEGDLDAGGITTPVTIDPISAHTRTVTVTNRTSDPLTITVPTPLSADTWRSDVVAGQLDPPGTPAIPGQHVTAVTPGPRPNTVNVTLEPGVSYELRVGRVELHEKSDVSEANATTARYLVAETDRTVTTSKGRIKLVVEARDRYNNPVSNAVVNFTGPGYDFETQAGDDLTMPVKTDENGRATVWYNATGIVGNLPVKAYLGATEPSAAEKTVIFRVTNTFTGTGAGGGADSNINPGNYIVIESTSGTPTQVTVTLNNSGTTPANMTAMRYSFDFPNARSPVTVDSPGQPQPLTLELYAPFEEIPGTPQIAAGSTYTYTFEFPSGGGGGGGGGPGGGQQAFLVIEIVYDDAYVATYFIAFG